MLNFLSNNVGVRVFIQILLLTLIVSLYTQWKDIYHYGTQLSHMILNNQTSRILKKNFIMPLKDHCPPAEPPGRWRMVSKRCYVLSAYIDSRPQPKVVRIIGVHGIKDKGPDKCHLYFAGDSKPEVMALEVKKNPEYHHARFTAYIYTCPISSHRVEQPCAVRLTNRSRSHMGLLPIYRPKPIAKKNFTVCVPTLFSYNHTRQLVQTIEANRFFGADKFVIYNTSSSREVKQYLSYYIKNSIVMAIPWHLPTVVARGLHYHGQLVSILDCFYRSRTESNFVVFLDMDEVIVPHNASSWDEMIRASAKHPLLQGGYILKSKLFCDNEATAGQLDTEVQRQAQELGMKVVLRRTWNLTFSYRKKSKLIVSSESAVNIGVHSIFEYMPGYRDILVNAAVGMLHHYRLDLTQVTKACKG